MDRAELGREVDVLGVAELLAAEHHDCVAVDRGHDRVSVGGLQWPGEIDAGNLGKEARCGRRNRDAQASLLRL